MDFLSPVTQRKTTIHDIGVGSERGFEAKILY